MSEVSIIRNVEGVVKFFKTDLGYGFVVPNKMEVDVLVHHSVIEMDGFRTLEAGQKVKMDVKLNEHRTGLVATRVIPEEMPKADPAEAFSALMEGRVA